MLLWTWNFTWENFCGCAPTHEIRKNFQLRNFGLHDTHLCSPLHGLLYIEKKIFCKHQGGYISRQSSLGTPFIQASNWWNGPCTHSSSLIPRLWEERKKLSGTYCMCMYNICDIYNHKMVRIRLMKYVVMQNVDEISGEWETEHRNCLAKTKAPQIGTIVKTSKIVHLYPFGNQAGIFTIINQCI